MTTRRVIMAADKRKRMVVPAISAGERAVQHVPQALWGKTSYYFNFFIILIAKKTNEQNKC